MESSHLDSYLSNTIQNPINSLNSFLKENINQKTKMTYIPRLSPISQKNSILTTIIDSQHNKSPNHSKLLHDFVDTKKNIYSNISNKMNINDLETKLRSILINSKTIQSIFENRMETPEKSNKYIYHRKSVINNSNSSYKRYSWSSGNNKNKNKINNIFLNDSKNNKISFTNSNKSENKNINKEAHYEFKDKTLKEFLGEQIKQIKNKNGHFISITNIQNYNNNLYKKNLKINTYSIDETENNLVDSLNNEKNTSNEIANNNINHSVLNIQKAHTIENTHQKKINQKFKKINPINLNNSKNKLYFNFPQNFISYKEFNKIPLNNNRNSLKTNDSVNKITAHHNSNRKNINKISNNKLLLKVMSRIKKSCLYNNSQNVSLNSKKFSNKIIIPTPNNKLTIENDKSKNIKNLIFIKNNYNSTFNINNSNDNNNVQEFTKVSFVQKNTNKNFDNSSKIPINSLKKCIINTKRNSVKRNNNSKSKILNYSNVENNDKNKNSFSFVDVKIKGIPKKNNISNITNRDFLQMKKSKKYYSDINLINNK